MANISGRGLNRSGRFTSDVVTTATEIKIVLSGPEGQEMRIYNSGEEPFDIWPDGSGTVMAKQITLLAKSSVDVRLTGEDVIIKQSGPAIKGLYDYIVPQDPIRSGRFTSEGAGATITQGANNKIYRILNAGKNPFIVTVDGNARGTVASKQSIDVLAKDGRINISNSQNNRFRGIYDVLDRRTNTRSGRFKANAAQTIINFVDFGGNAKALYRIFNSGDNKFNVTGVTDLLAPSQSVDLPIGKSAVQVSPENANDPIQGIYDFIRPVS